MKQHDAHVTVIKCVERGLRIPFLDLDLVRFVSTIPLLARCDLSQPRGIGEKYLLRLLAKRIGLEGKQFLYR